MQKEIRVGVIGFGQMGRVHSYAYRAIPFYYDGHPCKITLKGVCDVNPMLAQKGIDQAGFEFSTSDYRQLVDRKDIDVINICTPNNLHAPALRAALETGKHIYCEKPLAYNEAEAREIVALADKAGVKHQITAEYRFIPAIMKAKDVNLETGRKESMSIYDDELMKTEDAHIGIESFLAQKQPVWKNK